VLPRKIARQWFWAAPWLLFQAFPVIDLVTTPRPAAVRAVAAVGLLVFTAAYVSIFARAFADRAHGVLREPCGSARRGRAC
jgi:two-component system sensor histidine kinase DesK